MQSARIHIIRFAAFAVLLALQIPLGLGIVHATEKHDHVDRCDTVSKTHIHEQKLDCSSYHVTLDNAVEYAFAKAILTPLQTYPEVTVIYTTAVYTTDSQTQYLRGPPVS